MIEFGADPRPALDETGSCMDHGRVEDKTFERLYEEHAQAVYGFLSYRTGDRVLAEDLLADTFERAYRARGRFDRRKASEKTWIYAIALNCLRDHVRRVGAEERAVERVAVGMQVGTGGEAEEAVHARDWLERGLAGLSAEEREAVALRYGADLSVPEIAKLLGEKLTTVEGRVYRGLRKLREGME